VPVEEPSTASKADIWMLNGKAAIAEFFFGGNDRPGIVGSIQDHVHDHRRLDAASKCRLYQEPSIRFTEALAT
jgi:hypothetical protein